MNLLSKINYLNEKIVCESSHIRELSAVQEDLQKHLHRIQHQLKTIDSELRTTDKEIVRLGRIRDRLLKQLENRRSA